MRMESGTYDHLNEDHEIGMSIPEIAKQVVLVNYGAHRMLSAIARELRDKYSDSPLAATIERALKDGQFY